MDAEEGMARQGEYRVVVHSPGKYEEDEWIKMVKDKIELPVNNLELCPSLQDDEKEPKISKLTLHEEISQPRVVTIGPFHRQKKEMTISDEEKRMFAYLVTLLYDQDLARCIKKVKIQEEKARERYSGLACEGFTEMLLLDSYFILFVLTIKIRKSPPGYTLIMSVSPSSLKKFDLLRSERTKVLDILCNKDEIAPDLLILDNQIPFFVIEELYTELKLEKSLHEYALEFFETIHPRRSTQGRKNKNSPPPKFSHLLHLFHWSRVPENRYIIPSSCSSPQQLDSVQSPRLHIPNAMKLRESAAMFEKKTSGCSSLDITFKRRRFKRIARVLNIPELHIRDYSSIIFHNLIAFEMQPSNRSYCTMAFSALMRNLLQSEEDVKLLRRKGILASSFMDDNKLICLFQSLSRLTENYQMPKDLFDTLQRIRSHHERVVNRFCGNIIHEYFPNPQVTLTTIVKCITCYLLC